MSIGIPVYFLSIKATHNSHIYKLDNETKYLELELFPALLENTEIFETPTIAPIDDLIPFRIIEPDLDLFFKKWFEIEENFESVVQLFFGVVRDRNLNAYHTFSSLIKSLEVYHRTKYPEKVQFEKSEFEKLKILIKDCAPEKYKEWISRALEFSNGIPLRARIKDLVKINSVIAKFFKNKEEVDSFVSKVTQTRNYTTHYNPDLKEKAAKSLELFKINMKLDLFIRIYFLVELGFEEQQIVSFLKNVVRYNEMFSKQEMS